MVSRTSRGAATDTDTEFTWMNAPNPLMTQQPSPPQPDVAGEPAHPTAAEQTSKTERRTLDLSFSGLIVGSLAAITAAALGAQLGVAGTIIGAGVGSLVSALATAIFNVSWHGGRSGLRVAYDRTARRRAGEPNATASDTSRDRRATGALWNRVKRTWLRIPRSRWRIAAVGTAAAFLVAFGSISAYEALTGHTLSGERGGTTISRLADGAAVSASPTGAPDNAAPAPTSETASPDTGTGDPDAGTDTGATPSTADSPAVEPPATGTNTEPESSPSPSPAPTEPQPSDNPTPPASPDNTTPSDNTPAPTEGTSPTPADAP